MIQRRTILELLFGAAAMPLSPGRSGDIRRRLHGGTAPIIPPMPDAVLLAALDTLNNAKAVHPAKATIALNRLIKMKGAASIAYTGKGAGEGTHGDMGAFETDAIFNGDPSTLGVITIPVYNDPLDPPLISTITPSLRNGATSANAPQANAAPKPGWFFISRHASEFTPALPPGRIDLRMTTNLGGNFPASQTIGFGAILGNSAGRANILIHCDDGEISQRTYLLPDLRAQGLVANAFIPAKSLSRGQNAGYLAIDDVKALRDAGWGICNDGSMDDSPMTNAASIDAAINGAVGLAKNRQFLRDNNLLDGKGGENHFCFPQGATWAPGGSSMVVSATTDGTDATLRTLTFAAVPSNGRAVAVGDSVYMVGVARGTKVATVISATSVRLTAPVSAAIATGVHAYFQDESGPFQWDKLPRRCKTEGFLSGRVSGGEPGGFPSRYGVGGGAMYLAANSIAGYTFARIKALIDLAVLRGSTVILLIHDYIPTGGNLAFRPSEGQQVWAYMRQLIDAGTIDNPLHADWWAKYCANPVPMPTSSET